MKQPVSEAAILQAAHRRRSRIFDPWNSSSSGHQRPETRVGIDWRDARNVKTNQQFRTSHAGGVDVVDTPAVEELVLGRLAPVVEQPSQRTVIDMLRRPTSMRRLLDATSLPGQAHRPEAMSSATGAVIAPSRIDPNVVPQESKPKKRGIFHGCVIYVNGSTYPAISDHKLKRLLSENGACMSIHLARRKVTHVILGRPKMFKHGAAGGLAAGKMENEIAMLRGCNVKYVEVEWVLESIKSGKRLPEGLYSKTALAAAGQRAVAK